MKVCVIEVPYGSLLLLPEGSMYILERASIVDRVGFDVSPEYRKTAHVINCALVDPSAITELQSPDPEPAQQPKPEWVPGPAQGQESVTQEADLKLPAEVVIDEDDLPF